MGWRVTRDAASFAASAEPLLAADPVANTLPLTVLDRARRRPAPADTTFAWWEGAAGVAGAVSWTATYGLLLAAVPDDAVGPLVDLVTAADPPPATVAGPSAVAAQVAAVWARRAGGRAVLRRAERLHRLAGLEPPVRDPAGAARVAGEEHRDLIEGWLRDFAAEAGVPAGDVAGAVAAGLASGGLLLWETSGRPVSLVARHPPTAGVVRIGPVWTPPPERGRGYATATTAQACRGALAAGASDVVLFTDLANPTSNAIYRRLGFRPAGDRLVLVLEPAG